FLPSPTPPPSPVAFVSDDCNPGCGIFIELIAHRFPAPTLRSRYQDRRPSTIESTSIAPDALSNQRRSEEPHQNRAQHGSMLSYGVRTRDTAGKGLHGSFCAGS